MSYPLYSLYPYSSTMPAYSDYLSLYLCTRQRDPNDTILITLWSTDTLADLKERIASSMRPSISQSRFSLEVFDQIQHQWKKINELNPYASLRSLNLRSSSTLSVDYHDRPLSSNQRSFHSTSMSNDQLLLKLCKQPFDTTEYTPLRITYASTIAKLRKKAYEEFLQTPNQRAIFVRKKDSWEKFDTDMDLRTMEDLSIGPNTFISLDNEDESSPSKLPQGLCGLVNLGNTCYMNSVFQCLSNIPEFAKRIMTLPDEIDAPIINQFRRLLKKLWSREHRSVDPALLVRDIQDNLSRYDNARQHDAQEFMNYFLNLIHAELSGRTSLITEFFYGHSQSTVKCLECQRGETTEESLSFLPLPISNCNQKTILYVNTNGEYRAVPIQVDATVRTVGDLINCFITQYEPKLKTTLIRAIRIVDNLFKRQIDSGNYLTEIPDTELAFLQCPEKSSQERYIICQFISLSVGKPFRPPTVLVGPTHNCYYRHLTNQLDQLLGHLCSVTNASPSDCRIYWTDRYETAYKLTDDKPLVNLETIVMEMTLEWVDVYRVCHQTNDSTDHSALSSLIGDFCREEPLDSAYHCSKCSKRTKAQRKSSLGVPLPRVLIIQLKRFAFDLYSSEKIDTFISFPLYGLDLSQCIAKDNKTKSENSTSTKYNLVAVSNHSGSLVAGHYTTYGKNSEDNQWYLFDDRTVSKVHNENDIVTKNAYILVYVRTS